MVLHHKSYNLLPNFFKSNYEIFTISVITFITDATNPQAFSVVK